MESIKPLQIIRFLLLGGSLLVMFFNLFDCIMQEVPLFDYFLYVGIFLIYSLILIFSGSINTIVWILFSVATIILTWDSLANQLSYAICLFILTIYLKRDLYYKYLVYFITLISVVFANVIISKSPADLINVIIGYIVVYSVAELVYLEIRNRYRGKE